MQMRCIVMILWVVFVMVGCYPPQIQYPYTKLVQSRRSELCDHLMELLPEAQKSNPKAQAEARWLADTAYKAAAGVARVNGSYFPGWAGNVFVNTRMQDRGLCWHYQHDMYRELRRRPLSFFRIGCCVRDKKLRSEHNCVYIAAAKGEWPNVWVLDAWMFNGRLKVDSGISLSTARWEDRPNVTEMLAPYYYEGHALPSEHWLILRGKNGKYSPCNTENALTSPQCIRMYENIKKGYREHPGSPTNY